MKVTYRDYEIDVYRAETLGGWENLYFSVYSADNNKPCLGDGYSTGIDTIREMIKHLKARVDDYYAHPEDYTDAPDTKGGE